MKKGNNNHTFTILRHTSVYIYVTEFVRSYFDWIRHSVYYVIYSYKLNGSIKTTETF